MARRKLTEDEVIEKTRRELAVVKRRLERGLGNPGSQQNAGTELYKLYHCLLDAEACLARMEAREEMTWDL